jgi:alpha-L-arabinofuranosidase
VLATSTFKSRPAESWRKFEAKLSATRTDPKARFALSFASTAGSTSKVWIDFVSLFPAKTFRNRPNGMRPDLAQMVADLKPGFMRFPGGCYAEGITVESRPQWKASLGRLEDRPGTYSPWGYWSSDGLGFHEFLQFSEDVGADALYVVNAGISCAFRSGTFIPDDQLQPLIDDTLDAIEYAVGPVNSKWGSLRAKAGHPKPFPLRYIEVGNEDQGARYGERFARFYNAIKARYPEMNVALDSWISGIDRAAMHAANKFEILDEHAYRPLFWSIENFDSFAKYPREGWDLYIGEFATNAGVGRGNLQAALGDAAYMMSMEKNADLVKMGSYAPLLENVNKRDWEVNLIHFDSSRIFGRASYYACKLFAENRPDVNLPVEVKYKASAAKPVSGRIGLGTFNTAAEFKDIRVESDGKVIYESPLSQDAAGWQPETGRRNAGSWSVADGAYRQSNEAVSWSYFGDANWKNVTVTVKARKLQGAEGFLVAVGSTDNRRIEWNAGGFGNHRFTVQANDTVIGNDSRGSVETGRWYDLRIEVKDRTLRCFLDGELKNDVTIPRVDTVLAIAGRDENSGDIVVKMVNSGAEPAALDFNVDGVAHIGDTGTMTVLTSTNPTDENSFEQPAKIAPVSGAITGTGPHFKRELPPYSLSILRLTTK